MKILKNFLILTILILSATNSFSQRIKVGSKMPEFELMNQHGEYVNSNDYLDKQPMVVFFYTEDGAEICTREVIEFNKQINKIKELNAVVFGINPASIVFHRRFVIKLDLQYDILFDRNNDVQKMLKVPNVKGAKKPQRYTFVVDKNGIIKKIFHNDKNANIHIIESIKTLESLI